MARRRRRPKTSLARRRHAVAVSAEGAGAGAAGRSASRRRARKARSTHSVAEDDAWVEGQSLIGTVEDVELIDPDLSGERLVYRLFHERGVRVFAPLPLARAMLLLARRGLVDAEKLCAEGPRRDGQGRQGRRHLRVLLVGLSNSRRKKRAWSRRARLAPQTRSSSPAQAGAPVFQRRRRLSGRAAAYWMPACAGMTTV